MNKVQKIVDQPPEEFPEVMDVNVTQSWLMARAAGRQMLAQGRGGKVILMSSARGLLGHPAGYTAYCASKSAVDGITKALGCEWGETGITVNALGPTVFRSPLTAWMYEDNERATTVRDGFSRACRRAGSASRPISPVRCCSSPRRHPISIPATSSTPTAAIRRAETMAKEVQSRIAVIGAGLMGHGIAQVFALAGHDVTITDTVMQNLDTVDKRIAANLRDLGDDERRSSASGRASISPRPCARPITSSRRCRKICR